MTVNPRRAIDLNANASLAFLKYVMPAKISAMNRGTNERLLEELPKENAPNEKWTAVRLEIPHEFRIRLTPQWVRPFTLQRRKDAIRIPKDPSGKVLIGLGNFAVGDGKAHSHAKLIFPNASSGSCLPTCILRLVLKQLPNFLIIPAINITNSTVCRDLNARRSCEGELSRHRVSPTRELANHQGSGMVDVIGQEGQGQEQHKGIEQRYMERG